MILGSSQLLTQEEFDDMLFLLKNMNHDNWNNLHEKLRNLFTLRWSYEEIIKGVKIMRGGIRKKLYDAMLDPTLIKFDIHLRMGGKYIEMSNHFILIQIKEDGTDHLLNLPQDYFTAFVQNLRYEVEKLYYNKQFINYLKMAKRVFSIARTERTEGNQDVARNMIQLLNSDAGIMNVIKSDLETIITMLEYIKNPPIDDLMQQLEQTKTRMAQITEININSEEYYKKISYITSHYKRMHRETIIEDLKLLKYDIKKAINDFAYAYLKNNGFAPPPRHFLPIKLKYKYP